MGILGIYVRTSIDKENTSIEQQKNEGLKFCKKMNFGKPNIYEDVGKSGFGIDKNDPFKNLKGLKNLLDDIEKKIIDKVWVWEHSRSSRDKFLSYYSNEIFKKFNVIIFEKGIEIDLNIPEIEFFQDIKTGFSILERHKIVERTKRGVHDTINRGIHSFNSLYGYKRDGTMSLILDGKEKKYIKWTPVKSEIENLKYLFEKYLEGDSVYSISERIFKKSMTEKNRNVNQRKITRYLTQFVYTGYQLTIEGREILNNYLTFKTDSIKELKNKKYYTKSMLYPIQIVSIENWIKITEKIQGGKIVYKDKMRKTNTEMLTGIMNCPYCELRYYVTNDKGFVYYKHFPKKLCGQLPKSVRVDKLDKYFEVFFFYFYLVYDDTKNLIEESQKIIKLNQLEIKDKIKLIIEDNKKLEKQIDRFQGIYESSDDNELLKLTLKKETELNNKKDKNNIILEKLNIEMEELNSKFEIDKLEYTYYDVKETIINFFENQGNEEKRMSLVKIIKNCQLFGKYIIIDTGRLLFIFSLEKECILTEDIYKKFMKDKKFKYNFMNSSKISDKEGKPKILVDYLKYFEDSYIKNGDIKKKTKGKELEKIKKELMLIMKDLNNYLSVRKLGDIDIQEIYLNNKSKIDIKSKIKNILQNIGIDYPIFEIEKIISFVDLF